MISIDKYLQPTRTPLSKNRILRSWLRPAMEFISKTGIVCRWIRPAIGFISKTGIVCRYFRPANSLVWKNRVVKGLCFFSAFIACVLLLRPAAFFEVGASLHQVLFSGTSPRAKPMTQPQMVRLSLAKTSGPPAFSAAAPKSGKNPSASVGVPPAEGSHLTMPQTLLIEEYKKVTSEIQERISQEQILFALKFTIVGGILVALFSLSKREDFEDFIQRRRAAVFFSAALLASAVIDVRLRFDIKVVETLGVYCKQLAAAYPELSKGWEEIFEEDMKSGVFPIMRNFSLSFTALIYSVTTYLYIILPSGAHKGTWKVMKPAAILVFVLLTIIGVSYGKRTEIELMKISAVLGATGLASLWYAFYIKASIASVVDVVGPIISRMRLDAGMTPEVKRAEAYLHWVIRAQSPERFARLVLEEANDRGLATQDKENAFCAMVSGNIEQSAFPKHGSQEAIDLFKEALPKSGATLDVDAFVKTAAGQKLKRKLAVDADEADWAEDYLWKFYADHQNALRLGQFARVYEVPMSPSV